MARRTAAEMKLDYPQAREFIDLLRLSPAEFDARMKELLREIDLLTMIVNWRRDGEIGANKRHYEELARKYDR
jgi:hypothetical protein